MPPFNWFLWVALKLHIREWNRRGKANYKLKHPEKFKQLNREYKQRNRLLNPEKWQNRDKKNYDKNKEQKLAYKRGYNQRAYELKKIRFLKDPEKYRLKMRAAYQRRKQNPVFRFTLYLRNRFNRLFKNSHDKFSDLVGCSAKDLKTHLESLFKEGMSWSNYGKFGWHIDHKVPCVKFDLTKESEVKKCFHWKNLQPLWWRENLSKNDRVGLKYGNTEDFITT